MNRRDFLRGLLAGAVATQVPWAADAPASPRLPYMEMGQSMPVSVGRYEGFTFFEHRDVLAEAARLRLPRGARFEFRMAAPTDYGRHSHVAWYADEFMQDQLPETRSTWLWLPDLGVYYGGRYIA